MKYLNALIAFGLLTACGGNPIDTEPTPVDPAPPAGELGEAAPIVGVQVPAIIANHLRSSDYRPGASAIAIDLRTLDGTPLKASYTRDPQYDVAGFDAYTVQETRSQRKFLAMFKRGGADVEAGVVADGGQFVNYFGGSTFAQLRPMTPPSGGSMLATYTGAYVGLLNRGDVVPGSALDPRQSYRVTGDVAINADFNPGNASMNGQIVNRVNVDNGDTFTPVYFSVTDVNGQGAFSGLLMHAPGAAAGNFAGAFGSTGAAHVAGGAMFNPIPGDRELVEHGAFVAQKCVSGDPAPCP